MRYPLDSVAVVVRGPWSRVCGGVGSGSPGVEARYPSSVGGVWGGPSPGTLLVAEGFRGGPEPLRWRGWYGGALRRMVSYVETSQVSLTVAGNLVIYSSVPLVVVVRSLWGNRERWLSVRRCWDGGEGDIRAGRVGWLSGF